MFGKGEERERFNEEVKEEKCVEYIELDEFRRNEI